MGAWPIFGGIAQGLQSAGQSVQNALQFAAQQKLQQQQLAIQQQGVTQAGAQQQFLRDQAAFEQYQRTGTDMSPEYVKGIRQFGMGGTDGGGAISPNQGLTTPDVSQTNAGGGPQAGTGPGALPAQLTGGANPAAVLSALRTAAVTKPPGASPLRPAISPSGNVGAGAGAGVTPGLNATTGPSASGVPPGMPSFMPSEADIAKLPPDIQRQVRAQALLAGPQLAAQAWLRGNVPEAVNPQQLALAQATQAEAARHNKAAEANEAQKIANDYLLAKSLQGQNETFKTLMFGDRERQNFLTRPDVKPLVQKGEQVQQAQQMLDASANNPQALIPSQIQAGLALDNTGRAQKFIIQKYMNNTPQIGQQWDETMHGLLTGNHAPEVRKDLGNLLTQIGQNSRAQFSALIQAEKRSHPSLDVRASDYYGYSDPEIRNAMDAISKGAPPDQVRAAFQQRTGKPLDDAIAAEQ